MSHPELFREDGTLHELAIERRIADELPEELKRAFDAHIAVSSACNSRYESARLHQESWRPPHLNKMPKNASAGPLPTFGNQAANRPIRPLLLPALGLTAAAAAVALFVAPGVDSSHLTTAAFTTRTTKGMGDRGSLSFEVSDEMGTNGSGTTTKLTFSPPGHYAVIRMNTNGTYKIILSGPDKSSIPLNNVIEFNSDAPSAPKRLIGFHCSSPFNVQEIVSEYQAPLEVDGHPQSPAGCSTTH